MKATKKVKEAEQSINFKTNTKIETLTKEIEYYRTLLMYKEEEARHLIAINEALQEWKAERRKYTAFLEMAETKFKTL